MSIANVPTQCWVGGPVMASTGSTTTVGRYAGLVPSGSHIIAALTDAGNYAWGVNPCSSGWFVPDQYQALTMMRNAGALNIPVYAGWYWTSDQGSYSWNGKAATLGADITNDFNKSSSYTVRCARYF